MQAGRFAEAEQVYRDDLARLAENGWSLFGLARSLELQEKRDEVAAVEARCRKIWSEADVQITSSCLCQPVDRIPLSDLASTKNSEHSVCALKHF